MTHYKITLLFVILPLQRIESRSPLPFGPFKWFLPDFCLMLSFPWIIRVPIMSPRSAWISTRLYFFTDFRSEMQKVDSECVCSHFAFLLVPNRPPPTPQKRMTTCQNMECGVCRFRAQALAFRLWEQAEQYICDCRDLGLNLCQPRTVLIQRCQKLLTCHRVSRNAAIATWCYKVSARDGKPHQQTDIHFVNL